MRSSPSVRQAMAHSAVSSWPCTFPVNNSGGSHSPLPRLSSKYWLKPPSYCHSSFSPVASLVNVMCKPEHNTALARRTCLSFGIEKFADSKYLVFGQKRTEVPRLLLPTSPTTLS